MILAYRHLGVDLTRRRKGRSRGIFQKAMLFCKPGGFGRKVVSLSPKNGKVTKKKQTRDPVAFSQQLRLADTVSFVRRVATDC